MNDSFLDFQKIFKALSTCAEVIRKESPADDRQDSQFAYLQEAENNFRLALSFGLSKPK